MLKGNTARECLGTTDIGGSADTRKELVVVIKTHVLVLGQYSHQGIKTHRRSGQQVPPAVAEANVRLCYLSDHTMEP